MPETAMAPLDRAEVEARIGATDEPFALLSGGLANRNVRVGRDRVLKIYRDASRIGKERALLSRAWRSFRTPKVLDAGGDFLVLEWVEHAALADSDAHGAAVGRALAEIHEKRYAVTGVLGADLEIARAFPGDGHDGLTPRGYGGACLADAAPFVDPALRARIESFLAREPLAGRDAVDVPLLSHCDFKASNLHWTPCGELLVLDWEFAWAGTRYIDIGQLLRWQPPEPFVRAFADAYVAGGGALFDDWRRFAELLDLGSLLGLYRNPAARSSDDVLRRIEAIIAR
ncbi:MAG TPA: aminoglycoside phosphotransferase family protein [Polyangia bacterium]|jgi:hypothetical protein